MRIVLLSSAIVIASSCIPDYGYVSVEHVPYNYAAYPRGYYAGAPAYYIDGRWYTRRHHGWGYYRTEPPELHRYRRHIEVAPPARQVAPPARQVAPPARQAAPPARQAAPPAQRVR